MGGRIRKSKSENFELLSESSKYSPGNELAVTSKTRKAKVSHAKWVVKVVDTHQCLETSSVLFLSSKGENLYILFV